jgi:bifunctional non-homologous end joining protein LigD
MCAVALRRSAPKGSVTSPAAGRVAPFPGFIEFSDPTLSEHAPKGEDWLYEIKADGYRAQAHLRHRKVTVYSRTGLDWTKTSSARSGQSRFICLISRSPKLTTVAR